jgi:hypothetical protein
VLGAGAVNVGGEAAEGRSTDIGMQDALLINTSPWSPTGYSQQNTTCRPQPVASYTAQSF